MVLKNIQNNLMSKGITPTPVSVKIPNNLMGRPSVGLADKIQAGITQTWLRNRQARGDLLKEKKIIVSR
jgi:hypothetical protein